MQHHNTGEDRNTHVLPGPAEHGTQNRRAKAEPDPGRTAGQLSTAATLPHTHDDHTRFLKTSCGGDFTDHAPTARGRGLSVDFLPHLMTSLIAFKHQSHSMLPHHASNACYIVGTEYCTHASTQESDVARDTDSFTFAHRWKGSLTTLLALNSGFPS